MLSRLALIGLTGAMAFASLPAKAQDPDPENTLVIKTSDGCTITAGLRPDLAPKHVAQIKKLARAGFYDGVIFHRVIEGFMAQTGDPTGTGTGGSKEPDLPAEFSNSSRQMHAAPGDDERMLRVREQCSDFGDPVRIGERAIQRRAAECRVPRRRCRGRCADHVEGAEQHGRSRPSARRRRDRHIDIVVHAVRRMNAPHPFATAAEEIQVVELLEGVAVEERKGDILHERQDRDRRGPRWTGMPNDAATR